MTTAESGDRALRARIVARARELGAEVGPDDLVLSYAEVPAAAAYRLVRASWGAGGSEDAVAGLVHADDEPDLLPARAAATLMTVWGTEPPPARLAAATLALLLDPLGRWEPLLTAGDVASWDDDGSPPTPVLEVDASGDRVRRVGFWWGRGGEAREVVVELDDAGRTVVGGGAVRRRSGRPGTGGEPS